jgi:hypothetical protein
MWRRRNEEKLEEKKGKLGEKIKTNKKNQKKSKVQIGEREKMDSLLGKNNDAHMRRTDLV